MAGKKTRRTSKRDVELTIARRSLIDALRVLEEARQSQTDQVWKGPVAARWNVVDAFEHRGQRYIIARAIPATGGLCTLTETERRVVASAAAGATTKEIGYALGLAATTVRVLIMRAIRRCRVRNRHELLALWREQQATPFTPPDVSVLNVASADASARGWRA